MKKILITGWVPDSCLAPYQGEFAFTLPKKGEPVLNQDQIGEIIGEHDAFFIVDDDNTARKELLDKGKQLEAVANLGVGYNNIDWKYATEIGLPVVNTPTAVTESTAEMAVALILSAMRGVARFDREIRKGVWLSPIFPEREDDVFGKTLGVVGFGRIGKRVCRKAQGLGMKVVYHDPFRSPADVEKEFGVTYLAFDELLKTSDCVTLHLPYTPEVHHMFNADAFAKMKNSAYFINAARGQIMDEKALAAALRSGKLKGAGLDVFEDEPTVSKELLALDNVCFTPHAGSGTMGARVGMCVEALRGIAGVLRGEKPSNVVNPQVLK